MKVKIEANYFDCSTTFLTGDSFHPLPISRYVCPYTLLANLLLM